MELGACGGELTLHIIQVGAVDRDDTLRVGHHDVLVFGTQIAVELSASDGGSTSTADDDTHVFDGLADKLQRIQQACTRDDSRTVLVVVHHGDRELSLQTALDLKALRSLDILEVDSAEGGGDSLDRSDECLGLGGIDLDIEGVYTRINLEEQRLTLHDGLAGIGTDIAQSEDGSPVGDDADEVTLRRIAIGSTGVFGDNQARLSYPWGVSQREVIGRAVRLGRDDSDLAGASLFVVAQRGFFRNLGGHIFGWIRIIRLVKLQQAKWENVPHSLARQRYG